MWSNDYEGVRMNDRFKFRVWDDANNKYVNKGILLRCGELAIPTMKNDYDMNPVDGRYSVEQCTGLKDKNGKLIYEGDILSVQALDWHKKERWDCEKVKTYWSVEYKNYWNHCGFMVFGINRRFHKPLTRTTIFNSEAIVVGNIHENPELLKEEQ